MRILIADDHELIRKGVRSVLVNRPDFYICGEAVDGENAVEQARHLRPDLIVMDISMPKLNGLEATREIRRTLPHIDVLVLSQHDSNEMMRQALSAGARGYVVKSAISADLVVGIDTVRRGELFFDAATSGISDRDARERERSQALERELQESEERFRFTFAHAAIGLGHMAVDGRWLRVNRKFCDVLGYAEEELRNMSFQDITHPADLPTDLAAMAKLTGGDADSDEYSAEKRFIRKDGIPAWSRVTVAAVRDSSRTLKYFVTVVEALRPKERAEQSANLLAAIVDSSDDAIISEDLDGAITSWNKAAERLFGYTSEEALGRPITLIIPGDRQAENADIIARIKRGEPVDHLETVRMHKDSGLVDLSVTISPVKDEAGRVIGAAEVGRDISERKRVEEALSQSEARFRAVSARLSSQVRERTEELEKRSADVLRQSEQLRRLSWKLLRTEDEERRHIARELHDSAGQTLVALSMNLSRIVQGVQESAPEIARLSEETREMVLQLSREIRTTSYLLHPPLLDENGLPAALSWYIRGLSERSEVDIRLNISESFGRLAPELELVVFRVVQECLANIHRHSGSGSASIDVAQDGRQVRMEIRDQGRGIPADLLAEIQSNGSGVGIRGMRERLRQFDGELHIDSSGSGTTIRVTIPIAESAAKAREASV